MNDFFPFSVLFALLFPLVIIRHLRAKRLSLNARCGKAFLILYCKIWASKSLEELAVAEGQVDDFYNDYACKAVAGLTYANELYSLIATLQMQMSKNDTHVLS